MSFITRNPPNSASWAVPKPEPQPSREQPAGEVGQEPLPQAPPSPLPRCVSQRRGEGRNRTGITQGKGDAPHPPPHHAPGTLPTCYRHHPFVCAPYTGHGDARYFDPKGPAPTAHPRVTSDRERVFFSKTHSPALSGPVSSGGENIPLFAWKGNHHRCEEDHLGKYAERHPNVKRNSK